VSHNDLEHEECSIARSVSLLGDRWTLILLRQAFQGLRRFEEFQASMKVSRALLAERLRVLVEAGILDRVAYKDARRTRHEYQLTDKGADLYPVLMALRTWGDKYLAPQGPFVIYRHRGCGGELTVRQVCDTCGAELTASQVDREPGAGLAHAG